MRSLLVLLAGGFAAAGLRLLEQGQNLLGGGVGNAGGLDVLDLLLDLGNLGLGGDEGRGRCRASRVTAFWVVFSDMVFAPF